MNDRLRLSVDNLLEGVQVIDRQWRYVYVNATAAAHGQRPADQLVGRTMMECYPGIEHTDLFAVLRRVMENRTPERLRNEFTYPTGERRWFDLVIDPVPDGICVLSLDVTDRRRIELELHHAQRMEAIGKLAGGVAHDFNNQLTVILGITELLLESDSGAHRRELEEVRNAARRSAALSQQLLAFSRRRVLNVEPTDLNSVIKNASWLVQHVLGASRTCEVRLHRDAVMMMGDTRQLENVLTNLVVNARDAMPDGGRLTITTSVVDLSEEDARQHAAMKPGQYAVLAVADTGCGMDEETKQHIFEPFFTTKEAGKGTGLGLTMVYGIVQQMNGFVWVYSERGHGTTFRLYFPTAIATRTAHAAAAQTPRHAPADQGGILVVEDDAAVREFITLALSRRGYDVRGVASGAEALAYLNDASKRPALVLADVDLPGTSGPDLARSLDLSGLKVMFMSGALDHRPTVSSAILQKPFTVHELLAAIEHALSLPLDARPTPLT